MLLYVDGRIEGKKQGKSGNCPPGYSTLNRNYKLTAQFDSCHPHIHIQLIPSYNITTSEVHLQIYSYLNTLRRHFQQRFQLQYRPNTQLRIYIYIYIYCIYTHTYTHNTYIIHTRIHHTYIHTNTHNTSYIHTYIHTHIHTSYIHAYIHTSYIHTHTIHTYIIRTCIIHTLHTYIHTYIHTFRCPYCHYAPYHYHYH